MIWVYLYYNFMIYLFFIKFSQNYELQLPFVANCDFKFEITFYEVISTSLNFDIDILMCMKGVAN